MIRIRPAEAADIGAMSAALTASIRDLCTADHGNRPDILNGWLANKTPAGVAKMLANPRATLFVAEHDGTIAAVGAISADGAIGLSLNGKSFPATEAYTGKVGDTVMVNYYNEGLLAHPMHLHQPMGWIIAKDGRELLQPMPGDTINVAPGERYTVLYKLVDMAVGLRVTPETEREGLDLAEHGERAYTV